MKTIMRLTITLAAIFISNICAAQNVHFVKNGIIEFEKRSNIYAIIKKKINPKNESYMTQAFDSYKKNNPQFKSAKSTLKFNAERSYYKFNDETAPASNNWLANDALVNMKNIVSTEFNTASSITQKSVYEATYLVKDSVRKITWKITDESRDIAGYECRRANAIIMDSIYVVAYYSNQIAVSGGPESFTGLPGMILGLALPHENITWFATKVTEVTIPEKDLLPPFKGTPANNKTLTDKVTSVLKNYGPEALAELKGFVL